MRELFTGGLHGKAGTLPGFGQVRGCEFHMILVAYDALKACSRLHRSLLNNGHSSNRPRVSAIAVSFHSLSIEVIASTQIEVTALIVRTPQTCERSHMIRRSYTIARLHISITRCLSRTCFCSTKACCRHWKAARSAAMRDLGTLKSNNSTDLLAKHDPSSMGKAK